jgi:hypothetical protein
MVRYLINYTEESCASLPHRCHYRSSSNSTDTMSASALAMQADDTVGAIQLLNGLVTQLNKGDALAGSFSRHACAAVLTVQQSVRASGAQAADPYQTKLQGTFQKLYELVSKRSSQGQVRRGSLKGHCCC